MRCTVQSQLETSRQELLREVFQWFGKWSNAILHPSAQHAVLWLWSIMNTAEWLTVPLSYSIFSERKHSLFLPGFSFFFCFHNLKTELKGKNLQEAWFITEINSVWLAGLEFSFTIYCYDRYLSSGFKQSRRVCERNVLLFYNANILSHSSQTCLYFFGGNSLKILYFSFLLMII